MPDKLPTSSDWLRQTPIAHRGLHDARLPENSLAAFEAAARAGYAIELDIRLTSDDQIVVIHDAGTLRMSGFDTVISSTPARQLTTLALQKSIYNIPLLADALAVIGGRVPVLIEVKYPTPARAIGPKLLSALNDYHGEYAVEAFDPRVVAWFRRHAPHVSRGQVASSLPEYPGYPRWYRAVLRSMFLNWWTRPNFIAFDVRDYPQRTLRFWRRTLHVPVLLWVVKTDQQMELAREAECNLIFESLRPSKDWAEHS